MTMRSGNAAALRNPATAGRVASALAAWRAIPSRHIAIAAAIGLAWAAVNKFGWLLGGGP